MKKSSLPIASPCGQDWEAMTPDGGGRFCASCDRVVHDLSSMSEARAKRLVASKGNLCIRYLFDEHGNVWFAGEKEPLAARLLNRAKRGAAVAAAIAVPLSLQACLGTMPLEDPVTDADAGHVGSDPGVDDGGTPDGGDTDAAVDAGADDDTSDAATDDASEETGDAGL